ncbi:hypothetical protein [Amycolatopsis anabasis]|uniref:hypothetical protein n=1 Tax=Amycolatopsis anabasis TaxID=1840409 RepID=UPI00131E90E9|nr:hypothetical protein [Amycolatopsis anabasis]
MTTPAPKPCQQVRGRNRDKPNGTIEENFAIMLSVLEAVETPQGLRVLAPGIVEILDETPEHRLTISGPHYGSYSGGCSCGDWWAMLSSSAEAGRAHRRHVASVTGGGDNPGPGGNLREQYKQALDNAAFEPSGNADVDRFRKHANHEYDGWCFVCQGDTAALANLLAQLRGEELARLRKQVEALERNLADLSGITDRLPERDEAAVNAIVLSESSRDAVEHVVLEHLGSLTSYLAEQVTDKLFEFHEIRDRRSPVATDADSTLPSHVRHLVSGGIGVVLAHHSEGWTADFGEGPQYVKPPDFEPWSPATPATDRG